MILPVINHILIDKCKLDKPNLKVRVISDNYESDVIAHTIYIDVDGNINEKNYAIQR